MRGLHCGLRKHQDGFGQRQLNTCPGAKAIKYVTEGAELADVAEDGREIVRKSDKVPCAPVAGGESLVSSNTTSQNVYQTQEQGRASATARP